MQDHSRKTVGDNGMISHVITTSGDIPTNL